MIALEDILLNQILDAKEEIAFLQRQYLQEFDCLISCSLNIPGLYKTKPKYFHTLNLAIKELINLLQLYNIEYKQIIKHKTQAGLYVFLCFETQDAYKIKEICLQFEENSEYQINRIVDFDVFNKQTSISRQNFNLSKRQCFLCSKNANICRREQNHSFIEIYQFVENKIDNFVINHIQMIVQKEAINALLYELAITPKPGLVDRENCGNHTDMNFFSFIISATEIAEYFSFCAKIGFISDDLNILDKIRDPGKLIEIKMLNKTKANTHKGAIFIFGVLAAAYGFLLKTNININIDDICKAVQTICQDILKDFHNQNLYSNGFKLFQDYNILGIRGQAIQGFPILKETINILNTHLSNNNLNNINKAGLFAFLHLLANAEDTTLIKRGNLEHLAFIQNFLKEENITELNINDKYLFLETYFKKYNLSAGGCADLLAASFFVRNLLNNLQ